MKLFNSKSKKKLQLAALAGFAILAVGCGRNRTGSYQGMEVVQADTSRLGIAYQNPTQSNALKSTVALNITEVNSDYVTGSWTSRHATGTFTGQLNADMVSNLILRREASSSSAALTATSSPLTGPIGVTISNNQWVTICAGEYSGQLKFDGDRMVGTISPTSNMVFDVGFNSAPCTQIDVDATKISD